MEYGLKSIQPRRNSPMEYGHR